MVDAEVKRFVEEGYNTAKKVILENIDGLHTIARALLEYETLTGDEIRDLMDGMPPVREDGADSRRRRATGVPRPAGRRASAPTPSPMAAPEPQPGA